MFRFPFWITAFWLLLGIGLGWWLHVLYPSIPIALTTQTETPPDSEKDRVTVEQTRDTPEYKYEEILALHENKNIQNQEFTQKEEDILEEDAERLISDDPKQAEKMLTRWVENDEYNIKAMFLLAQTYAKTNQFKQALETLFALKEYVQNIIPAKNIDKLVYDTEKKYSTGLHEEKAFDELMTLYQKMTLYFPSDLQYYYKLAEVQNQMGQFDEALASLNHILYDSAWGNRANTLFQEIQLGLELQNQVKVPLERDGEQFIVSANLNGIGNIRLLIDTGASISLLRPQIAQQIGLSTDEDNKEILLNTVSGVANAPAATVDSFLVGSVQLEDVKVSILEMPPGIDSDGLLGMNFLSRFRFFINQDEAILYLGTR